MGKHPLLKNSSGDITDNPQIIKQYPLSIQFNKIMEYFWFAKHSVQGATDRIVSKT